VVTSSVCRSSDPCWMMARPSQPKQLKIRHASVPYDDESAAIAGRLRKEWES
jgi:hypothetical protein